ncbi:OadG family protein [Paraglaciecola sp. 2405UD69-4]|uniref:OadG family protein n=1 Tax=Paraglaciecola sp. 2405UD69-4 TaxID=3391836 RepID=UPI0039C9B78C
MQLEVADALLEAANLLLVGMVVVFLFLTMLIGAINFISWLNKLIPDPSLDVQTKPFQTSTPATPVESGVSPKIVAAIGAAVKQHRQQN